MPADAMACDPAFTQGLVVGLGLGGLAVLVVLVLTFLAMHRSGERDKAAALVVGTLIVALVTAAWRESRR
jgi:4-amino-4-deoxy-L-arabinose transferase-like glycosyltransferase